MKTMLTTVLAGTLVLALAAGASAAVIWNGEQDPTLAGYEAAGSVADVYTYTTNPDIMHQYSSSGDVIYWKQNFVGGEMTRANGWFIQTRLDVLSAYGNYEGVAFRGSDEVGYVVIGVEPTQLVAGVSVKQTYTFTTTGYHTIRVAMPAGGSTYDVYVDDMDTPVLTGVADTVWSGDSYFGDGSSGGGGVVDWDYFYVNYAGGPPPDPIPGDANGDDVVDDEDASILAAHWQQPGGWGEGDFNNDGVVNDQDASILAAHWGESQEGSGAPVPEPSVLVLLFGAGLIGLLARARRRR